jgi:3-hydroxybutyryl-CoA dehydrogenase
MVIKTVFIAGAGSMGSGIAQVTAQAGYAVLLEDINEAFVQRGLNSIGASLDRFIKKGQLTAAAKEQIVSRIHPVTGLAAAAGADLVIEAIPENLDLKVAFFREIDTVCPSHAILASNTSSMPISAMAAATQRRDKVMGMHFMIPAPVIKGVELIRTKYTSEETLAAGREFIQSLGKEPCEAVDYAGFIVTRILDAMMNEAVRCAMDGNRPEEIDKAMRVCCNMPIGPLELADLSGNDIVLHGLETLEAEFGERFHAAALLKTMVRNGDLGRKTGGGFYKYDKPTLK